MLRVYGKKAALFTLLGDMLKTALSIALGACIYGVDNWTVVDRSMEGAYLAALFCVLGHIAPVYYKFRGGKGVLATATMALIITPLPFAILITLFIIIVAISKYVSLGSVCVASLYPVAVYACIRLFTEVEKVPVFLIICTILLAITVVWCHRENLKRLANGTERKLSFGKKEKK
jgi:glycerol-3-phosphate acyltransferase PlsY